MAEQNIDQLSIEITANASKAKSALSGLSQGLTALKNSLVGLSGLDKVASDMSEMAVSLSDFNAAVVSIDTHQLKMIGSALKQIGAATGSFNAIERTTKTLDNLGHKTSDTASIVDKQTKKIAEDFNIDTKDIDNVRAAVDVLFKTIKNGDNAADSLDILKATIKDFANFGDLATDSSKKLDQAVRSQNRSMGKIHIPQEVVQELGDDYSYIRKRFGKNFSSSGGNQNDLAEWIGGINEQLGTHFNTDNVADGFREIASALISAREESERLTAQYKDLDYINQSFADSANQVYSALQNDIAAQDNLTQSTETTTREMRSSVEVLSEVAERLKGFQDINFKVGSIAELGTAIMHLGANGQKACDVLPRITQTFEEFKGFEVPKMDGLETFAKSIHELGLKKSEKAVDNINHIVSALKGLNGLNGVNKDVVKLVHSLALLSVNGGKVAISGRQATNSINAFGNAASRANRHTFSLAATIGKVYASYWLLFRAFGKLKQSVDIASSLTEIENVVNKTFDNMSYKMEDFVENSIMTYGMSELTAKQIATKYQAMGAAMDIPNKAVADATSNLKRMGVEYQHTAGVVSNSLADMSLNLTALAADMASFYDTDVTEVAQALNAIYTGQTRPLRQYGIDLTQANLTAWALKEGLDANIDSMTQAEKTMLRYQYVLAHTTAAQGDFQDTMTSWHNQVTILKQQFQQLQSIVGGALIQTFKSALSSINKGLSALIGKVQLFVNAIGKLLGWEMVITDTGIASGELADSADDIASGYDDAAKAAKKLKNAVLGIDELNINNPNSNGGGGSSAIGGGGADDYSKGKVDLKKIPYESDVKSWFDLGQKMRDSIVDSLNGIDWDDIQSNTKKFAHGFAELLNGLISPDDNGVYVLGDAIGRFLAQALNTGVDFFLEFATTYNWFDLGMTIATGINTFFETFDFADLADAIDAWVQGIYTTITTAITNVKWGTVWDGVREFLTHLDLETVEILVAAWSLKTGIKAGKQWFYNAILTHFGIEQGVVKIPQIVLGIGIVTLTAENIRLDKVFKDSIKGPETSSAGNGYIIEMNAIEKKFKQLRELFTKGTFADYFSVPSDAEKLEKMLLDIQLWGQQMENNGKLTENYNDVWTQATDIWIANGETMSGLSDDQVKKFTELYNAAESYKKQTEGIGTKILNVKERIEEFTGINIDAPWIDSMCNGIDNIQAVASRVFSIETWQKFAQDTYDSVKPYFTAEKWAEITRGIKDGVGQTWDNFKAWWNNTALVTWWRENVAPWFTKEKWTSVADGIKTGIKTTWNDTVTNWKNDLQSWWNNHVAPWFTAQKWQKKLSTIPDSFKKAFADAVSSIKQKLNDAMTPVNNFVNKVSAALDRVKGWISDIQSRFDNIRMPSFGGFGGIGSLNIPKININIPKIHIKGFASGGIVDGATLFQAGEHGIPEMLGTVGGRTAVAGGAEITGIREAVDNQGMAEQALLNKVIALLQEIADKDTNISLDGRELISQLDDRRDRNGYEF